MYKYVLLWLAFALLALPAGAQAAPNQTLALTIVGQPTLEVGKPVQITVHLADRKTGVPLTENALMLAHTQRFHALILDQSLSDYHHEHPTPADRPGDYVFTFTPQKPGGYRLWADITPAATGKQQFVMTNLKRFSSRADDVDKTVRDQVTVEGLTFALSFDASLRAKKAVMGKVTVSKDGESFTGLEPVMGAYAHIVGFNEDLRTVAHVHPMGDEPEDATERGGPSLEFHIEPPKPGFTKLFVQVRVGGKDVFAPFGLKVKP